MLQTLCHRSVATDIYKHTACMWFWLGIEINTVRIEGGVLSLVAVQQRNAIALLTPD